MNPSTETLADRDLVITRLIDAAPEHLYRAWTEPELLKQWFTPPPWTVSHAELDVRPGGSQLIIMNGPDGEVNPCRGIYLEVIPNERLVATDAFVNAWEPSEKAFMTTDITFVPEAGKTRYTATVRHWSAADRKMHEDMGFHQGWNQATDQLVEIAKSLGSC